MWRLLSVLITAIALTCSLQAREMKRSVEGKAGQDTRLGLYGSITPDCKQEPTPPVRIAKPPAHGTLIIGVGQTKVPPTSANCAGMAFTVLAIFFRPAPDFDGSDQTTLEFQQGNNDNLVQVIDLAIRR